MAREDQREKNKFHFFTYDNSKKKSLKYNHSEVDTLIKNLLLVFPSKMSFLSSVRISASYFAPVRLANVYKIAIILPFNEVKIQRKYTVKVKIMNDFFHRFFVSPPNYQF